MFEMLFCEAQTFFFICMCPFESGIATLGAHASPLACQFSGFPQPGFGL